MVSCRVSQNSDDVKEQHRGYILLRKFELVLKCSLLWVKFMFTDAPNGFHNDSNFVSVEQEWEGEVLILHQN